MQQESVTELRALTGSKAQPNGIENRCGTGNRTIALVRESQPLSAAEAPTTLSRPIMAMSTDCPLEKLATREMIPLWGKYTRWSGLPASITTALSVNSTSRRYGPSNSLSCCDSDASS